MSNRMGERRGRVDVPSIDSSEDLSILRIIVTEEITIIDAEPIGPEVEVTTSDFFVFLIFCTIFIFVVFSSSWIGNEG